MSKRFIPVLVALILGGLFITYAVNGKGENKEEPQAKYQRILRNVGIVLEQGHYSPKKIDDAFSKAVMENFLKTLDPDKYVFLEDDITALRKYETRIDDEIHGAELRSFYEVAKVYNKRLDEAEAIYKDILSKPFDFSKKEVYETDGEKKQYPASTEERYNHSRKRLKYFVLTRLVSLQEERERNKKDSAYKADSTLIREAVEAVSKQTNRFFETLKNHNSQDELFSMFVNTITSYMDPHTNYMAPIDKRTFDEMLSGTFYGIGAQLREQDGRIKIVSLVAGGPAWKNGELQPEDEIMKVGEGSNPPVDITGYALPDAVKIIRGSKKGSEVRLTVKKVDGTVKVITLLRDEISLDEVYARSAIIQGQNKIGYILLPEFYANFRDPSGRRSGTDVAKEILKLKEQNIDGLIVDLRGNGGGSLQDVVEMFGLFIEEGPVVQVKGRNEKTTVLYDEDRKVLYSGPLTVLVDEFSASASEIFAAAVQDYHRGIVLGSTSTYGKGTVQRSISLEPQSESSFFSRPSEGLGNVKLTFRKFYRINGGTTQRVGVVPDVILPSRNELFKMREKDNPAALGWDEISKAKYDLWKGTRHLDQVIRWANEQVDENKQFTGIKRTVNKIEEYRNDPVPLNLEAYVEYQNTLKSLSQQLDSFSVAHDSLKVVSLPVDIQAIGSDTLKKQSQSRFINSLTGDLYVEEAVKVLNKMISQKNTHTAFRKTQATRVVYMFEKKLPLVALR